MILGLRRLLVLLRVVKLGFRLRRDASAAESDDGPDGTPVTRILSARLTPEDPITRDRSGVVLWSSLLLEPSFDDTLILGTTL